MTTGVGAIMSAASHLRLSEDPETFKSLRTHDKSYRVSLFFQVARPLEIASEAEDEMETEHKF